MAITRITKGVIKPNENYDTHNIVSTGIITSVGADINGDLDVDGHTNLDNVSISGVTTFGGSVNNLVLSELDVNGNADISGNLSVGGVLTYEDVTSIDSVGIITARNDIHVGAGVSAVGVGTFGSLDIGGDIDVDGHTNLDNVSIAGVSTFASKVSVGGSITATGLIQATSGSSNGIKLGSSLHLTDAANTQITQQNNASIYLNADNIELRNRAAGSYRQYIRCGSWASGAVGLFHDDGSNANERLRTTSSGINVTGNVVSDGLVVDGNTDLNGDLDVDGHTNLDNVSIAGVTTTTDNIIINADNKILKIGASQDLHLFHQGGTSIIKDINDNPINIQSDGEIKLAKDGNAETYARFIPDGAVELYHDNVKKFETTVHGGTLTGSLTITNDLVLQDDLRMGDTDEIQMGDSLDFRLYHTSGTNYIEAWNNSNFKIAKWTGSAYENMAQFISDGAVELYFDANKKFETTSGGIDVTGNITGSGDLTLTDTTADSAAGPEFKLFRNSSSPADADYLGQIKFAGESDTGVERNYAKITGKILDASNGTEDGIIEFAHIKAGSQNISARFRSDSLQLLNGTALTVAGSTTVTGNIIPSSDSATDIGTNSVRFANIYADTLYGDGSNLTGVTSVGGNTGVDFNDNIKARFGTGNDLELYHNGTDSWIVNNTGYLRINSDNIFIKDGDNGDLFIRCQHDAGVTLYYNNDRKFEILNTGAIVVGTLSATTFSGSGASLTSIPAAQLTGTLPAIDGSNLTGISISSDSDENTIGGTDAGANLTSGGGEGSTFFGYQAGQAQSGSSSKKNTFIGYHAGKNNTDGAYNTFIGDRAGRDNTSASNNVCIGEAAGQDRTTGASNVNIGNLSNYTGNGSHNVSVGFYALSTNPASNNTAVGSNALRYINNTNGGGNVGVGRQTGISVTSGANNTLLGYQAGASGTNNLTTGSNNIILGYNAAASAATVSNEITLGDANISHFRIPGIGVSFSEGGGVVTGIMTASSFKLLDGSAVGGVESDAQYNTVAGTNAGDAITSNGTNNTAFGYNAITDVTEGDDNTAVGFEAGLQANASTFKNTFIGSRAGRNVTTGTRNTYIGYDAGRSTSNKSTSTCVGYNAGLSHDGSDVVCVGSGAGENVHTGCVSIGAHSGGNSSGTNQVFIGYNCGKDLTGNSSKNTLVGYGHFGSNSGARDNNTGVGYGAAWKCQGDNNTFVGTETLENALGAANNSVFGYKAGDLITTGDNNIVIGANADPSSATVSNEVTIGDSNITKFRIPGINVTLKDNGGTPTQGHVLTVDGNGEAGFAAASGTTINNNSDDRLITGTGTANTINAEADLTFDGTSLKLTDHKNMYFGTGNDLRIWHDANNSYSQIAGGQKNLYIDGLTTYMRSGDGGGSGVENAIVMNNNASVDLYYSGTKKFATDSTGFYSTNYGDYIAVSSNGSTGSGRFGYESNYKMYLQNTRGTGTKVIFDNDGKIRSQISDGSSIVDRFEVNVSGATVTGDLTASGFVDSSSDIKLKTNIKTIDNALDKVLQLRGAEYDRIDRDNQHEIGVIAQEVEEVIPELVHGDETKTVSYGNMVAVLIEAIKEQNEVINKMKKEIEDLKG